MNYHGIQFFDLADNRQFFNDEFRTTLLEGAQIAQSIGLLEEFPDLDTLLVDDYLSE